MSAGSSRVHLPNPEKIVTENEEAFAILERLGSEQELTDLLLRLVRVPEPQPAVVERVQEEPRQAEQVEASSPWGEFLRRKKKLHQNKHKLEANAIKATLINPQQTD